MQLKVKICGISTLEVAKSAINDTANFLGFIHFAKSPRHLPLGAMSDLFQVIRAENADIPLVTVVVNPDDSLLEAIARDVKPDLIQLHGHESAARVAEIAAKFQIPLIKVISVAEKADLKVAPDYEPYVEYIMFDAKAPKDATMPGGLGLSFDWGLMQGYSGTKPWFLAGGLTPETIAPAVQMSGAPMLDVSSGVESAPGVKDVQLISRFLRAAKSL
jgi:phosphoribosylanthranilate isomerase